MKIKLIGLFMCAVIGLVLVSGCGTGVGGGGNSIFANRSDAVYSANGDVPFGAKAYSPDNQKYACEIDPKNMGNIGIFDRQTDQLILQFKALPSSSSANPLKGLAWSPDSRYLAVMYHSTYYHLGVELYDALAGKWLRHLGPGSNTQGWFHYMIFSADATSVLLSTDGKNVQGTYPTGIVPSVSYAENSGANLPWINYGWDVGRNPWGGAPGGFSSNSSRLASDLALLAQNKVKVVRVFTFCDLRSGILFDPQGNPTDFDSYAANDFSTLISAIESKGLKVIPVLFDYMLADGVSSQNGTLVGEHPDLITDPTKRQKLINLFSSFISRYANRTSIYAWDVMNEPEYATAVNRSDLEDFVRDFTSMIHQQSAGAKVTLGCSNRGDISSWTTVGLDIYQFHYYDSMAGQFPLDFPANNLGLDKPVLVGELQPSEISAKMDVLQKNGYLGGLFWSLNADYDLRSGLPEFRNWAETH